MPSKKKPPATPTAPLAEKPEDLSVLDRVFDGCPPAEGYSSYPFLAINGFEQYAKDLFQALRVNGRGEAIFPDEKQFLTELDTALHHYAIYRPIVTPELCGTFDEQRKYFQALKRALNRKKPSTRLLKTQECLGSEGKYDKEQCRDRRFVRAGLNLKVLQRIQSAICDSSKPVEVSILRDLETIAKAVDIVLADLKGKNSGKNAELYLLIEQLGDMYETCSGQKPKVTEPTDTSPPGMGHGVFFKLVGSITLEVFGKRVADRTYKSRNDGTVKPYTIIEGIRFLK